MIKKPKTKKQLRCEIEQQIQSFLTTGQDVNQIPRGVSSHDDAQKPLPAEKWHMEKSNSERTYIPEVIDALEKRKQPKIAKPAQKPKKPRKKLIYDDFGEPLRWIWVDE